MRICSLESHLALLRVKKIINNKELLIFLECEQHLIYMPLLFFHYKLLTNLIISCLSFHFTIINLLYFTMKDAKLRLKCAVENFTIYTAMAETSYIYIHTHIHRHTYNWRIRESVSKILMQVLFGRGISQTETDEKYG